MPVTHIMSRCIIPMGKRWRGFLDELAEWTARDDVIFTETVDRADQDWQGEVGVITTLIPNIDIDPTATIAVLCGPPIMYKFVIVELFSRQLAPENIYLSLERRMKCGVGKCGHCQINGKYCCQEGPVFTYSDIKDKDEAL